MIDFKKLLKATLYTLVLVVLFALTLGIVPLMIFLSVEHMIIIFPIVFFCVLVSFVYHDIERIELVILKAKNKKKVNKIWMRTKEENKEEIVMILTLI